jgi:NarL family two-component system response regulator LiaR
MSEQTAELVTVLIVDDHAVVRKGVRGYLEAQPDIAIAGEAASGEEAVRLAAEHMPDVILMDLLMPGMDGVEATVRVRQVSPRSQVIVLTSYHEDEHIFPAIKAGALSYLLKNVRPEALADAVRAAAQGKAVLHSSVVTRVVQEVRASLARENLPAGETPDPPPAVQLLAEPLSERELEVLGLIAAGLTNREIARRLFIAVGTVKRHINNIYSKLEVRRRTEAVKRSRDLNLL